MSTLNNSIISAANCISQDWTEFMKHMIPSQKQKLYSCQTNDAIKLYLIALKYGLQPELQEEVFSIDVSSPEEGQNFGAGYNANVINDIVSTLPEKNSYTLPVFTNTLAALPEYVHSCWLVFAKKHATINNWTVTDPLKEQLQSIVYILLEDINEGELIVNNNSYNQKGKYHVINEEEIVNMKLTGSNTMMFALQVNTDDLPKIYSNS